MNHPPQINHIISMFYIQLLRKSQQYDIWYDMMIWYSQTDS